MVKKQSKHVYSYIHMYLSLVLIGWSSVFSFFIRKNADKLEIDYSNFKTSVHFTRAKIK